MTGLAFVHGTPADLTSPSGVPIELLAASAKQPPAASGDSALRAAIVKSAQYYLRLAQTRTPAEMEALIWQHDSLDGADHGESCAAFASLTLEAGAQATGQQSWVTGGSTYPWPVHTWVDARVDPNPESPSITSILQDAQANSRWHPVGDGYTPQPGDWVLFDGHVEVVTSYSGGILSTIGGDSGANLSVNAHTYSGSLAADGVAGFVNNGNLASAGGARSGSAAAQAAPSAQAAAATPGQANVPGLVAVATAERDDGQAVAQGSSAPGSSAPGSAGQAQSPSQAQSRPPGPPPAHGQSGSSAGAANAAIPGAQPVSGSVTSYSAVATSARYSRSQPAPAVETVSDTSLQQAFIEQVAPGARAAQQQYGVPAAVTIAQAIDESGWGQSLLATQDNNLFGIKGSGPAGSVLRPTIEYENGQPVTISAPFRVYDNVAQSIADHGLLLATGSSYKQAMADRGSPDAFANDLTGVYATDPNYGASLISLMRQYNLYRFDITTAASTASTASSHGGTGTSGAGSTGTQPGSAAAGGSVSLGLAGSGPAGSGPAVAQDAAIPGAIQPDRAVLGGAAQQASGRGAASGINASRLSARTGARTAAGVAEQGPGTGTGTASIPGVVDGTAGMAAVAWPVLAVSAQRRRDGGPAIKAGPGNMRISTRRYAVAVPRPVSTEFMSSAKTPLLRSEPIYREVADSHEIRWELLAACDWMQCQAQPRLSPVYGETLGTRNPDGTMYRSKAEALDQVAADLVELAAAVYGIDLRHRLLLSVRELASAFAAFRWGGLLKAHRISAMLFPYSVEGLTASHLKMRWPDIPAEAPDKPGTRFRQPFGAVPVVLGLDYPAVA
jgi:flagellum-specific peptidoglycan hydrolase FlgJ